MQNSEKGGMVKLRFYWKEKITNCIKFILFYTLFVYLKLGNSVFSSLASYRNFHKHFARIFHSFIA